MTHQEHPTAFDQVVQLLADYGFDGMAQAMQILMNEAMKIERNEVLNAAPYERCSDRRGYANGYKPKTVNTRIGSLELAVPQTRNVEFYPKSLERGVRSERALKLAVAEMYVQGVSTRKVAEITQELCGLDITSTQVSRAAQLLDEELHQWRNRPLGEIPYLILDARYEKVRHGGSVIDCAVLIAIGITPQGKRSILGVSDDHAGLKGARKARFAGVPWQRCQCHLQQNAGKYVPKVSMRKEVAEILRKIFDAADLHAAEQLLAASVKKYEKSAPKLATWLEANIPEGLTVMTLPAAHRKRLRTTNMLERQNREIKRRTRVATLFPNEASLLRLVSAVLSEISEDWETGKTYLNMETE